jgi:uncharacterized membrane protein YfcA
VPRRGDAAKLRRKTFRWALLSQLDPATLALVALIAYGSAVFHSVGGFAGGLLLTICLAPLIGIKETVPVVSVALIVSNITRVWVFHRAIRWSVVVAVHRIAIPGIVVGAVIYVYLPVAGVALVLGIFLIASLPVQRWASRRNMQVTLNGLRLAAIPYGVLAGTSIGAGMLLAPFLLGVGLIGESLVGVVAALGLGMNVTKTIVFGISPLLDAGMVAHGLLVGLCTIPGAYTGRWIVRQTSIRVHARLMEAVIFGGGLYFLWRAAGELL